MMPNGYNYIFRLIDGVEERIDNVPLSLDELRDIINDCKIVKLGAKVLIKTEFIISVRMVD